MSEDTQQVSMLKAMLAGARSDLARVTRERDEARVDHLRVRDECFANMDALSESRAALARSEERARGLEGALREALSWMESAAPIIRPHMADVPSSDKARTEFFARIRALLSPSSPSVPTGGCPKCRGSGLGTYGVDEGAGSDTCTDCKGTGRAPTPPGAATPAGGERRPFPMDRKCDAKRDVGILCTLPAGHERAHASHLFVPTIYWTRDAPSVGSTPEPAPSGSTPPADGGAAVRGSGSEDGERGRT